MIAYSNLIKLLPNDVKIKRKAARLFRECARLAETDPALAPD